jgi:uncharacterized membrane protein
MAVNPIPNPAPTNAPDDRKVRQVELLISTILRLGVIVSLSVIIFGTIVTFIHHPQYFHSSKELDPLIQPSRYTFPRTFAELFTGLRHFEGRSIVVAGLLLLIATPVMRVAVSIFAFVYERDRVFVSITTVVLMLLLLSFILGRAE